MEDIIIKKGESEHNGWFVEQGDKVSCECGWDEMMGLVSALTMPNDRGCLRWMKPKVDKYIPKDGDFVVSSIGNPFIYKDFGSDNLNGIYGCYFGIGADGEIIDIEESSSWTGSKGCKPATEEEKQLLLSKLHEFGKDWCEEKKEVVDWK